jgi:hypothetical protein
MNSIIPPLARGWAGALLIASILSGVPALAVTEIN